MHYIPARFMLQCSFSPFANFLSEMQTDQRLGRICSELRNVRLFVFQTLDLPSFSFLKCGLSVQILVQPTAVSRPD